jgi:hypothetical protein
VILGAENVIKEKENPTQSKHSKMKYRLITFRLNISRIGC